MRLPHEAEISHVWGGGISRVDKKRQYILKKEKIINSKASKIIFLNPKKNFPGGII